MTKKELQKNPANTIFQKYASALIGSQKRLSFFDIRRRAKHRKAKYYAIESDVSVADKRVAKMLSFEKESPLFSEKKSGSQRLDRVVKN